SNGVETSLTFNFAKISVTDQPTTGHGIVGTPQTFAFDLSENKIAAAVSSDIVSSAGLSAASAAVPVPASSPLHYFLKIGDLKGDSTVKGFEGWFSVDGYDIGVHNTGSLSSGAGGGAGKAEFSPLTVDIHSLAGLSTLFGDVASGHHLNSVELVGAQPIKGESLKGYDLKLSEVLVSSFESDPSSNGVETSLTFNFAKISLTDQPTTKHGIVGTPQTFAFDLSENKIAAAVSSAVVSSDIVSSAGLSAASAAVPVPASSPLHYFLKIGDLKGDSTVKGFEGWFSVDGYDIGVHNTGSLSSGAGGGAGKAEFSPLTVDIHSLAGLSTLFGDVASGHHLNSVELVGAQTIKGESLKVYDLKLSEVLVSSFENDPSSNGVETSLTFNFAKISLTDQPTTKHGIVGTPQTFAFDLSENKIAAAVSSDIVSSDIVSSAGLSAASAAVPVPASSPLHYFLKIGDLKGDSTVKGFEGWFSVDGYDIGVHNTGSLSSGAGGGAGKAEFSPLTVDIHSLAGLSTLFGDVASG